MDLAWKKVDLAWAHKVPGATVRGQPHIPPLLVQTQSPVSDSVLWPHREHVTHVSEGPGSSLGSAGAGGAASGEVVCLPGLVGPEDVLGMFQVALG